MSRCKESSTSNSDEVAKSSGIEQENKNLKNDGILKKCVRPGNREIVANNSASEVSRGAKKPSKLDSPLSVESLPIKKYFGRPKQVGRGTAGGRQRPAMLMKGKKRGRTKSDS